MRALHLAGEIFFLVLQDHMHTLVVNSRRGILAENETVALHDVPSFKVCHRR